MLQSTWKMSLEISVTLSHCNKFPVERKIELMKSKKEKFSRQKYIYINAKID